MKDEPSSPERAMRQSIRSTTVLAVRHADRSVLAGDGQVTLGQTVIKSNARKVRRLGDGLGRGLLTETLDFT